MPKWTTPLLEGSAPIRIAGIMRGYLAIYAENAEAYMRHITRAVAAGADWDLGTQRGLFRQASTNTGPAGTVDNLFSDLRTVARGEFIAEHPERHLQGTRLQLDRTQGHACWELYRLDDDLYVVTADGTYDSPRVEEAPGEGFVEFHLRLCGALEMSGGGYSPALTVTGPTFLTQYQPPGIAVLERVMPKVRDTCVSLYCRPNFLADLALRSGIDRWPLLDEIQRHGFLANAVWHRQEALSATLLYIGKSLLDSPYQGGLRLLHAEAKALELLCEVLAAAQAQADRAKLVSSEIESRQLDTARRLLTSQLTSPLRIGDIARSIGMSESKLKRTFKARFGRTVFDYGLDCRMRHALELLRCKRMSVGQVAFAVGYRHQTSFASAFSEYFGFLPSKARTELQ